MDTAQVRILILVVAGAMFFGQALYNFFKKQRRQTAALRKPQPRRRPVATQPRQAMQQQQIKPLAKPHPFLSGESIGGMTAGDETPPPETTGSLTDAPPSTDSVTDPREELRRAVIWSEILRRKY